MCCLLLYTLGEILKGSGNMTPPNASIFHQNKKEGKCRILDGKLIMKIQNSLPFDSSTFLAIM